MEDGDGIKMAGKMMVVERVVKKGTGRGVMAARSESGVSLTLIGIWWWGCSRGG